MSAIKHPSEIAREALKQLAARKLAPTPANFQACYNEIAQLPNVAPFPEPALRQIAAALAARNAAQVEQLALLDSAIGRRSWQGVQDALVAFTGAAADNQPGTVVAAVQPDGKGPVPPAFLSQLARVIESVLPALASDETEMPALVTELLQALRNPAADIGGIQQLLGNVSHRLSFAAEEQVEVKHSLLHLLQLIIENIGQLSLDDSWLKGQTEALLHAVAPPISLRRLDDIERRLKDVLFKQSEAKSRSIEAQEEVRQMLSTFVERLAVINESSATFQGKIEESALQIEQVKRIEDLAPLLKQIVGATRTMAEDTARTRDHLNSLQEKVLATQADLVHLHMELDNASAMARHDLLTDTLNRKGLDEALVREIAGVRRKGTALSVCLLDIDNFKKLNDRLGHHTGDGALIHLAEVTRGCMRSVDSLARYGGEEFVILMPDTPLDQGIEAMRRLQRELTKNFFLAGEERVLITFSAGVAQLAADENGEDAIKRADQAMYLAKRAGKNRVMAG